MTTLANSALRKKYAYLLGNNTQLKGLTSNFVGYELVIHDQKLERVFFAQWYIDFKDVPFRVEIKTLERVSVWNFRWKLTYVSFKTLEGRRVAVVRGKCSVTWKQVPFKGRLLNVYDVRIAHLTGAARGVTQKRLRNTAVRLPVKPGTDGSSENPRNRGRSSVKQSAPVRPNQNVTKSFPVQTETNTSLGILSMSAPKTVYSRTWTGVRTPNFGRLAAKQLPVNPHTVRILKREEGMGYDQTVDTKSPYWIISTGPYTDMFELGYLPGWPVHNADAYNKAVSRLIQKAGAGVNANIAQDIAQWTQMQWLIGGNLNKISTALRYLRRKNIPAAVSTLFHGTSPRFRPGYSPSVSMSLARNWLALQYGWKPLLSDIHGVMEATRLLMKKPSPLLTQSASCSITNTVSGPMYGTSFPPSFSSYGSHDRILRTRCRIGIRWKIDNQWLAFASQLGFTNPINLLWEVIPFSFVLDWALPIGPYLEALSSFEGLVFVDGFQTLFTRQDASLVTSYSGPNAPGSQYTRTMSGSLVDTRIVLDRSKLTSFPRMRLPTLKNPLSVTHALNALALLKVVFSKR